ncbi:MAG: cheW-like domain protein, partial [Herminiimonas sp.]|nr:cheW-like domain protein [Herminiimonas sp.]
QPVAHASAAADPVPEIPALPEIMELDPVAGESMAAARPVAPVEPLPASVVPETDEAVDAELLEIFLTEAVEVLAYVRQTLPQLRKDPRNLDHMTSLRRSFHTLKGSGRMVGLMAFGEAAWRIERVLNLRLSEGQEGSADLYGLLDQADEVLGAWVSDLQTRGMSDRNASALISAAERVMRGEPFVRKEDSTPAPVLPPLSEISAAQPDGTAAAETVATQGELQPAAAAGVDAAEPAPPASEPPAPAPEPPIEIEEITLADAGAPRFDLEDEPDPEHAHDPAPALPVVTIAAPEPAPVAKVIEFPDVHQPEQKPDDNIKRIGSLEISVPLHNIYLAETDDLVRLLTHDLAEWRHERERSVNILAVHAAHSLSGSSATVGFTALQEVAYALEMILQSLARKPEPLLPAEFDALEGAVACMKLMLQKFALGEMPDHEPQQVHILQELKRQIIARSGTPAMDVQSAVPAFYEEDAEAEQAATVDAGADTGFEAAQESDAGQLRVLHDELDPDLLPVFLEEGRDILPQMGKLLRAWHAAPADRDSVQSLLRLLHTIKGSARMAGAMGLGQHMHEMESRIEQITRLGTPSAAVVEELLARLDVALYLFELLQNPEAAMAAAASGIDARLAPAAPVAGATGNGAGDDMLLLPSVTPLVLTPGLAAATSAPAIPVPLVRVRADILDRLVNQAGEVSISRSRVETEVAALKQTLTELSENVMRLRGQLREIEMQAETQIASQMQQSADREFDPLEFDRFTRLQELTRMMAESVNDVASVQQNLSRTVDEATSDLVSQARLTRDLQQDLMRVRMVQFASISERLYRITRQASKELDKRVNLDIRGGSVEIDRSVLEKMAGPFEHLLRNAIVHGIESRERRLAAGKSEIGELLVEIRQEGNEVVIRFSDDGQGLDLDRIRLHAMQTGLLSHDALLSESELTDLIFHPGFSTAQEITELAGRGVGMDVVRAEAASLGGRIAIASESGKGAQFTIHLPLTLAVTQVVVLATGGKTYAVPSVLVEQVQQLKSNALASAYNDGAVMWQDNRVPLYYLSALLGDRITAPLTQQYSPIVILKSGNDRVAIHVDAVMGNREVVVKNIGPQLSRMIGIAGATVLGAGDIVLILDPVPLAQRLLQETARAPRLSPSDAPDGMGAVAEITMPLPMDPATEPVQGLRTQNIVMVVDDSLTVRRVTQRLLAREGYQVVLAKDGVDALEQLQAFTPDVMLVDIEMPRMDGFDLTRNVRGDERTSQIPIVMITSRTATKHRNYALELGVNEYLGKPYQETELLKLIAGFLKKEAPIA